MRVRRGCISRQRLMMLVKQAASFQMTGNRFRLFIHSNVTLAFTGMYLYKPKATPVAHCNFRGNIKFIDEANKAVLPQLAPASG